MEQMSGLDASFLYFETPSHLMHIGLVVVVDPGPGGADVDAMQAELATRVASVPALLRKPRHVPLDLGHPVWVEDDRFDLGRHVRRLAVPSPGTLAEVAEVCGHLSGMPLDRDRPLWEMWFLEGMADGRVAIFVKLHHAMVDGVAGASLMAQLCGLEPPVEPGAALEPAPARAGDAELVARAVLGLALKPAAVLRMVPHTVAGLARTAGRAARGTTMAAPFRAPRLPFNGAVSGRRSMAFADLSLAELKEVKDATGTTVNDVLLTVVGGALRRYLADRDHLPVSTLVANIPVSVRHSSARPLGRNKVSTLFARLGTHLADPVERLRFVHAGTTAAKQHATDLGADTLQDWAEVGAGRVVARVLQAYSDLRLADRGPVIHNLVVSNIPGPAHQLTFLGARLDAVYPLGPVMDGAGLNVTVMSHAGTLHVGLHGCREQIPDLADLAAHLAPVTAELLEQVRAGREQTPARTADRPRSRRTSA